MRNDLCVLKDIFFMCAYSKTEMNGRTLEVCCWQENENFLTVWLPCLVTDSCCSMDSA